jgi:isochorismate synthase EntC
MQVYQHLMKSSKNSHENRLVLRDIFFKLGTLPRREYTNVFTI